MAFEDTAHARIAGRYALGQPLGRGGMGVVWRATDELLHREVAIKQVELPEQLPEEERESLRSRVLREARAAARVLHPALVTVFDVIQEHGNVHIVMELVAARTLSELVEAQGPLSPTRVAQIGLDLLGGIEAAHRQGIVHRDVKPSNIMVLEGGPVKLADFGIASVKGHPDITATGLVLGSPAYMAPEQAQGERSGPATDMWGLGATLYYAVEGTPPFDRRGAIPTLTAVVHDEAPVPKRAGLLAPVLMSLLAKDPDGRPATDEVRRQLMPIAQRPEDAPEDPVILSPPAEDPVTLSPPSEDREEGTVASHSGEPPPQRQASPALTVPDRRPSRTLGRTAAAVGLPVLVLALALVAWRGGGNDDDRRPGVTATTQGRPATTSQVSGGPRPVATPATSTGSVPAGWIPYTDADTGYRIARPPDWQVQEVDRTRTDIRDPKTGSYLRIDWTDRPGPSPVAAWRDFSRTFAARHEGYREVRIEPTTYKGFTAAVWEYTYSGGGGRLRATNLGMVTGRYGFALNFQTPETLWERYQPTFDAFKEAFQPVR